MDNKKNQLHLKLLVFTFIIQLASSLFSQNIIKLPPQTLFVTEQDPLLVNSILYTGSDMAWADEGRVIDIEISPSNTAFLEIIPNVFSLTGPPCPIYGPTGRVPDPPPPPNTTLFSGEIKLLAIPPAGTSVSQVFSAEDKGYWTKCAEATQVQFNTIIQKEIILTSIKVNISTNITCNDGKANLLAITFPSDVGEVTWTTPTETLTGQNVSFELPMGMVDVPINAKFEVDGAVYEDNATIHVNNLVSFDLPYCSNKPSQTKDIAILNFDGDCHPKVNFDPPTLDLPSVQEIPNAVSAIDDFGNTFNDNIIMVNEKELINNWTISIPLNPKDWICWALGVVSINPSSCNTSLTPGWIPEALIGRGDNKLCCPNIELIGDGTQWEGGVQWNFGVHKEKKLEVEHFVYLKYKLDIEGNLKLTIKGGTACNTPEYYRICGALQASLNTTPSVEFDLMNGYLVKSNIYGSIIGGVKVTGEVCVKPKEINLEIFVGKSFVGGSIKFLFGLVEIPILISPWEQIILPKTIYY